MVIAAAPTVITIATTIMTDVIFLFINLLWYSIIKKALFESLIRNLNNRYRTDDLAGWKKINQQRESETIAMSQQVIDLFQPNVTSIMPTQKIEVLEYECTKCSYRWINRVNGKDGPKPKRCAKCKRSGWEEGLMSEDEKY